MKIKKIEKIIETIGFGIWLAYLAFLILNWDSMPNEIPGHYDDSGMIDKWINKSNIIFFPLIGGIVYSVITAVTSFKEIWEVPAEGIMKAKIRKHMRTMLMLFKLEFMGCYFYFTYHIVKVRELPEKFVLIQSIIILATLICFSIWCYYAGKKQERKLVKI